MREGIRERGAVNQEYRETVMHESTSVLRALRHVLAFLYLHLAHESRSFLRNAFLGLIQSKIPKMAETNIIAANLNLMYIVHS